MTVTIYNWKTGAVVLTIPEATNCVGLQCSGFNLTNADFTGQNVRCSDFRGANLSGAKFNSAKTGSADFTGANITGTTFTGQDSSTPNYVLSKMFYNSLSLTRINDVIFRNNAIQTDLNTGIQYATLYRRTLASIIMCQRPLLPTPGAWTHTITGQAANNPTDGHHDVAFAIDGNSICMVAWSWLDTSYIYWNGTTAGNVNVGAPFALPIVAGESALEQNPVYPEFKRDSSIGNDVVFSYWCVGSGNLGTMIRRWDAATRTWSTITQSLFICGFNTYLCQKQFDSQGRLWVAGNYRDDPNWTNFNLVVAISDPADGPLGSVWREAGVPGGAPGTVLTLPVRPTSTHNAVVFPISITDGLQNTNGFCLTDDDRGIFGYWTGDPCNYHVCNQLTDGTWIDRQVGTQGISFTLQGDPVGITSFPLCQPRMVYKSGNAYAFFRSTTYPGLWCYKLSDAQLTSGADLSTMTPIQVCEYDAVGYAPSFDEALFESTGELHFFMSRCSQLDADLGNNIPAFAVQITLP